MNGLKDARSPFLRHGATQPVAWHAWGADAFELARVTNRPILLDIGAVWCHWCHVMDRESYEDPDTAALINELFVPVKVDRDERPDVDARYQRAVQVLTGQGGWPLTAFLTPDGEVFHGGTYFPPVDAHGRPSFRRVLGEVSRVWQEEPGKAADAVRGVRDRLSSYTQAESAPGPVDTGLIDATLDALAESYDVRYGGFGRAPKFPNAGGLDLLLDAWLDDKVPWARRLLEETLAAMARGGIYDQLGGGFHRYSTDARWIIPHFEKMAADNGVLARTFARVFAATGEPLWREIVVGIADYYRDVSPDLLARGGFPASQDADFGFDNDGDYWTWTDEELQEALADPALARLARLRYGLDDPAGSMHIDASRHTLFRAMEPGEIADRLALSEADVSRDLERIRSTLKAVRDQRQRPFVDESLYSDLVAIVAAGHLASARYVGEERAAASALRALDRLWTESFDPSAGMAHLPGEPGSAVLSDQVHVAAAMLDAFELTQDRVWLERADTLMRVAVERFLDDTGAFRDRPRDAPVDAVPLERPHYPITDSPEPSANGTAALVLLRLHESTGETEWRLYADGVLGAFAAAVPRFPTSASTYVAAVARATLPVTRVVVVAALDDPAGESLLNAALRTYRPRTSVVRIAPGADTAGLPDELVAMIGAAAPRAYVCAGRTCAAPVSDPAALTALMREFRG